MKTYTPQQQAQYKLNQKRKLNGILATDGCHGGRALCPPLRTPVYFSNSGSIC